MFHFAKQPTADDYRNLANHLHEAEKDAVHPSLWEMRTQVVDRLQQMAQQPEREANRGVYHGLRLFVW